MRRTFSRQLFIASTAATAAAAATAATASRGASIIIAQQYCFMTPFFFFLVPITGLSVFLNMRQNMILYVQKKGHNDFLNDVACRPEQASSGTLVLPALYHLYTHL